MKATILLADSAQVANGKLHMLGGGWNLTGPDPAPSALALLLEVPWDRTNENHRIRLELLDADGHALAVPDPDGNEQPLVIQGEFEVGRPPGLKRGAPINVPLAFNLPPLPLALNSRYEWRLAINDESRDEWRAAFSTRS